jgi:NitT/TauT family transport system substrate-binding protein
VLPNYVRVCLTTTGKTLARRRADAVGFLAAEMEALRFAVGHRDDTVRLTQEVINTKPDDPRAAFGFDDSAKNGAVNPTVALPIAKLQCMQEELVKAGNLKAPIDLAKITDASIRAEAEKHVGK